MSGTKFISKWSTSIFGSLWAI